MEQCGTRWEHEDRVLRFFLTEKCLHGGSTDGTGSLHGMSAILHRHLLRVLHFRLLFALDTIGFSQLSLSLLSTERVLGRTGLFSHPHCSTGVLLMQEPGSWSGRACETIGHSQPRSSLAVVL